MDKIYSKKSKYIDSIAAIQNLLDFIEESSLLETNEVILTNYRAFVIDINLESYFEDDTSTWDQINRCQLNLVCRSYKRKFTELLEKKLDIINIEDELCQAMNDKLSRQILEIINQNIIYILDTV